MSDCVSHVVSSNLLVCSCPLSGVLLFRQTARGSYAMTRAQLEDLIPRAIRGGYRINNLFQYQTGQWQANLRRDVGRVACFSYAKGDTPAEALAGAIRNAGIEEAETPAAPAAAVVEVADLLG